jgi:hypothetical protein
MHDRLPGLILAYHGCDRAVGEAVLSGETDLRASNNNYDWLGHGIYFWEHNPTRAIEWARQLQANPRSSERRIANPMALGAVIDPGVCLNLLDSKFLAQLPDAFEKLCTLHERLKSPLPQNRTTADSTDLLLRHLDCAVIETLHQFRADCGEPAFDSVRGVFVEGEPLYPGAAIQKFNHIQICIRNPACIRGYFRVRDSV